MMVGMWARVALRTVGKGALLIGVWKGRSILSCGQRCECERALSGLNPANMAGGGDSVVTRGISSSSRILDGVGSHPRECAVFALCFMSPVWLC